MINIIFCIVVSTSWKKVGTIWSVAVWDQPWAQVQQEALVQQGGEQHQEADVDPSLKEGDKTMYCVCVCVCLRAFVCM